MEVVTATQNPMLGPLSGEKLTYGHLLPGSRDEVRERMDAYLAQATDFAGHRRREPEAFTRCSAWGQAEPESR